MPISKRFKTTYPGVYFIKGPSSGSRKQEKIYYIRYRKNGKLVEEKAGRQLQDNMTPARAAGVRSQKIEGNKLTNEEQRIAIKTAELTDQNKWTIDKLWAEYKSNKSESKSLNVDDNRYINYIQSDFGNKEPNELIPFEIERLKRCLLKKLSPQTVRHVLGIIKRIVNYGFNNGLCAGIGFRIQMPAVDNEKTEDLTPNQLKKLLDVIKKSEDIQTANFMKLCLYTGMRRGELFNLKWDDVDFNREFIKIRDPKGKKDQDIPLNTAARSLLKLHERTDSCYIFPDSEGNKRTQITRAVNKIKNEAGLPKDFRPLHGLRHFFASQLANSGKVDMYELQRLMTHKTPRMTQRYAHLRDDTLKQASNIAGELIEQAAAKKEGKINE